MMSRFFVGPHDIEGDVLFLRGQQAKHAVDVMRLTCGNEFEAFDGSGRLYRCIITEASGYEVVARIDCVRRASTPNTFLCIASAIPKNERMDSIITKCTELGIARLIPMVTERTIVRVRETDAQVKYTRWKRLAVEACKQSGRLTVPEITQPRTFEEVLQVVCEYELGLIPWLGEKTIRLADVLAEKAGVSRVIILIGPEGDFTDLEAQQASRSGCIPVSLGPNVLRSDTAAIAATAIVTSYLAW
jgi:16S rRNA (uracil1498-N3)-methyltransferase